MVMHRDRGVREPPWADSRGQLIRAVGRMGLAIFAGGLFGLLAWPPDSPSTDDRNDAEPAITDAMWSASQGADSAIVSGHVQPPALRMSATDMPANKSEKTSTPKRELALDAETGIGMIPRFTASVEGFEQSTPIENSRGPP